MALSKKMKREIKGLAVSYGAINEFIALKLPKRAAVYVSGLRRSQKVTGVVLYLDEALAEIERTGEDGQ